MANKSIYISCAREKLSFSGLDVYHFFDYGLTVYGILPQIEEMNDSAICGDYGSWRNRSKKLSINDLAFNEIIDHFKSADDEDFQMAFQSYGEFCPKCIARLIKFLKDEMGLETDMALVKKLEEEAESKRIALDAKKKNIQSFAEIMKDKRIKNTEQLKSELSQEALKIYNYGLEVFEADECRFDNWLNRNIQLNKNNIRCDENGEFDRPLRDLYSIVPADLLKIGDKKDLQFIHDILTRINNEAEKEQQQKHERAEQIAENTKAHAEYVKEYLKTHKCTRTPFDQLSSTAYLEFSVPIEKGQDCKKHWQETSLFYNEICYTELFHKSMLKTIANYDYYSYCNISETEFIQLEEELLKTNEKSENNSEEINYFINWAEEIYEWNDHIGFSGM